ncbi:LysR family transcriptional regulator [Intestinimonas butyriciproducens]|jgi:transcriptional regulator|uniref:LysR family transcriptional regulator n=2 Tax=Intestinimonas butyriciproducens TaxID=1297617 RepID=UPI001D095747|nr:LysR family transcriptional regulator [Intestinimonas butyriciproducens]MCB7051336.1 LysR family transcriptional regulator [Intestinimonas butyriciproducens]
MADSLFKNDCFHRSSGAAPGIIPFPVGVTVSAPGEVLARGRAGCSHVAIISEPGDIYKRRRLWAPFPTMFRLANSLPWGYTVDVSLRPMRLIRFVRCFMKQIQLEYFIEVVEQNNFTKAAEKLFISQSALSKSIQSLEKELDTSLFTRDPRELKLTEEGRLVYHYAKDVLNYWHDRTAELFSSLNYKKGTLRFGLPPSAGSVYFSRVLYLYSKEYDHVDLQIFEEKSKKIEEMVLNDKLDLGVVVEPFHNPKLELKTVFRSEAVLAVSKDHRFADRKEIDFAALKEEPMLAVSKDYMYYDQVILYCQKAGFTPNIVFHSSQWDILLEMAAENQGVTIIGKPLVEKMYSERLNCIHLKNPEFPWGLGVIYKKGRPLTVPMKCFLALCGEDL